jgi:hypothetical protein
MPHAFGPEWFASMRRISAHALVLVATAQLCGSWPLAAAADEPVPDVAAGDAAEGSEGMLSVIEVAPEFVHTIKRLRSFYGDPATQHGGLLERSFLLDDAGGARDWLADRGIFLDLGVTQFLQSNLSGGAQDTPSVRGNGSMDLYAFLDSGKAGLWPGGLVIAHGEGSWVPSRSAGACR